MLDEWQAALLRHIPPIQELKDAGKFALGPAAAAAIGIFALNLICFGKKAAVPATSWAMLIAFGVANYLRDSLPWLPEKPFQEPASAWYWLALLFLLAQHISMYGRDGSRWSIGLTRLFVAGLTAWVVVPQEMQDKGWPLAAFVAVAFLGWLGSESVARQSPGGMAPLIFGMTLFSASMVVAHAHSARFADALAILGAGLVGIAVVAFATKTDASGAFGGAAVLLPSVLLIAHESTYSEIPWHAFLLAALPPVTMGLFAVRPLSQVTGIWRWLALFVFVFGPAVAAFVLAVRAETLIQEW